MKKLATFWMIIFFCGSLLAQTAKVPTDTIVRLGGKKIPCKVLNVSSSTILYSAPDKTESLAIDRKEIEKIIFKTGRVEVFNKPVLTMIQEGQWESILVTRDEKDTHGLYNRGVIKASSSPSNRSKKAAKQSAIIKLQKKAANLGGTIILLTKEESKGAYGDIPGFDLEAIVYGTEPLEKGTDVVDDKTKETPKK
ncbi:MAG: hypothetical protein HC905_21410 [Bacteroidales bacterium]|nr:hypothetical protein [Bacteroidales bacterium]